MIILQKHNLLADIKVRANCLKFLGKYKTFDVTEYYKNNFYMQALLDLCKFKLHSFGLKQFLKNQNAGIITLFEKSAVFFYVGVKA